MGTAIGRVLRYLCTCGGALALLASLLLVAPGAARATGLTVTNCTDSGVAGDGSLRGEIATANAATVNDTITFSVDCPGGTPITLNSVKGTLTLSNTSHTVTIDGTGHTVVVEGGTVSNGTYCPPGGGVTMFTVNMGVTASLSNLTIQRGNAGSADGGGILSNGTLTVTNSTITANCASDGGGGIFSGGALTLTNSTVASNGARNFGGGIYNAGTLTLTNSTLSGNIAGQGGGIVNFTTLTLTNSTLSGNTASQGGGIDNLGGGVTLTNTIAATNSATSRGPDLYGAITSGGHNLIGKTDGSSGWVASDLTGTAASPLNPLLGSLGSYSGTTQTLSLLPGSPAIDAGDDTVCTQTGTGKVGNLDQRGISRTGFGAHCDIGAFESRGFTLAINGGNNQSAMSGTAFASPLAVTVTSSHSEPVQGGAVTFTAPGGGASAAISGSPATVDGSGGASVTATANNSVGSYIVTASAAGAASVAFTLTNLAGVSGIDPPSGGTAGGNNVTLTGGGFGTAANTPVLIDGVPVPAGKVISVTGGQIIFVAPAHGAGTVTITVSVNGVVLNGSVTYQYGAVSTLPGHAPTGGTPGNPSPVPGNRPSGSSQPGSPNPLPGSRP